MHDLFDGSTQTKRLTQSLGFTKGVIPDAARAIIDTHADIDEMPPSRLAARKWLTTWGARPE